MGYEVALAEPLPDFYLCRKPLPHDLRILKAVVSWVGRDGIVYCGHNVLYWLPLLKRLSLVDARIVSLLFAREPLHHASGHSGIIALTPAAAEQASILAPRTKTAHLGWGVDLNYFPRLPYRPNWLLSCGKTRRDHDVLSRAAGIASTPTRVICSGIPATIRWPANVAVSSSKDESETVSYGDLLNDHYANCVASLIVLKHDSEERTAVGFTNLIEAMAMARPVIVTRTGALPGELDVEKAGCGIHVPSGDPGELAKAMKYLTENPDIAQAMGKRGRELCESHYNINRYAIGLHDLFETL